MSSAFETLLEAARFIELQEQRERLTSTSSTASSLSTSPYNNSRYQPNQNYASQSLVSTPPASPLSDGPRNHNEYGSSNGSTVMRNGELYFRLFSPLDMLFGIFKAMKSFSSKSIQTFQAEKVMESLKSTNYYRRQKFVFWRKKNYIKIKWLLQTAFHFVNPFSNVVYIEGIIKGIFIVNKYIPTNTRKIKENKETWHRRNE